MSDPSAANYASRIWRKFVSVFQLTWRRVTNFLFYPASLLLGRVFGIRIANLRSHRIGHLAMDVDCFLKECILDGANSKTFGAIYDPVPCNSAMLDYWISSFPDRILTGPKAQIAGRLGEIEPSRYPMIYNSAVPVPAILQGDDFRDIRPLGSSVYHVYTRWGDRLPLVQLTKEHRERGRDILKQWGIGKDDWFVCLHARESGWDAIVDDADKARRKSFRNSDINTYRIATETIAKAGGWCIRMGDSSMTRLPAWERTIDYAHSTAKADWMDLFLCADSRFFLGTNSGLFGVACVFGVPCALCNLVPMTGMPVGSRDIGIGKLLKHRSSGELISFPEILETKYHLSNNGDLYDLWDLDYIDNSEEEIGDLASEMIQRLDGSFEESENDRDMQNHMLKMINQRHMCHMLSSQFATTFLRRHSALVWGSENVGSAISAATAIGTSKF